MADIFERSLQRHRETQGKIEVRSRMRLDSPDDLSLAYTPGVARPCEVIAEHPGAAWDLTWKGRTVAVVSDGSAVLGLGDIGPKAALPVMEGKAALFREFAGIDAVPVVLDAHDPDEIVRIVRAMAPTYGGINLEDISAPRCFQIEADLQDIGIPVLHDDQHGTAIVLLAAVINATRVLGTTLGQLSVVINGAGAAGRAIAHLLTCVEQDERCIPIGRLRICDSKGLIWPGRPGNDDVKEKLGQLTNPEAQKGSLRDAIAGANVFIGVSRGDLLKADDIRAMAPDPIVLAMANPTPEIHPKEAIEGGAAIVGTGRSDFPNQVNNVLAFPGLFRGALAARATTFTNSMKYAAIDAIVACMTEPTAHQILPSVFDRSVAVEVARYVEEAAHKSGVCHEPAPV
ncbi:MAG: NADP-dependent malic enzyme [Planctomycetota bacterium]|nr:NADP-dependent malic enzyme [Planctomycetota bacterium]